jgi:hypothetical protein
MVSKGNAILLRDVDGNSSEVLTAREGWANQTNDKHRQAADISILKTKKGKDRWSFPF